MNDWNLEGKKALITGGTAGIGLAIAECFLKYGAEVFVTGRDGDKTSALIESLRCKGYKATGLLCDVSSHEQRIACVKSLCDATQNIDILVNNVGPNFKKPIMSFSDDEFNELLYSNLTSTYHITKLCYPLLKNSSHGASIINISAISSFLAFSGSGPYGMAKAGIESFTRSLACELGREKIRANAILPGFIATETFLKKYNQEYLDNVSNMIPAGRMGRPDDIANLALFLAMPASDYISGQCISVDGAFTVSGLSTMS
jgi:Tropinone reductase 1